MVSTRLQGMQKVYYRKVYEIQSFKRRPYSKAYKYREDIRKLHEWNERYLFLLKYDVHDLSELEMVRRFLEDKKQKCQRQRTENNREKKQYKELFELAHHMEHLLPAEHSFQTGDSFFAREHEVYQECEKQLMQSGYSMQQVLQLEQMIKHKAAGNYEQRKEVQKEYKIAQKILSEYETKILQWYKEQKYGKTENMEKEQEQPKQR